MTTKQTSDRRPSRAKSVAGRTSGKGWNVRLAKFWGKNQNRLPLIKSIVLHLSVIVAFSVNWHRIEPVEAIALPAHIQATVVDASQVDALQKKKQLAEKKKQALIKKKREAQRKKQEAKRKKELARKKALIQKKKAEERKKKLAKQKAEKERAAREKAKQDEAKKQRLAKEKAEQEKKQKELQRKQREEALLQAMESAEQERIAREKAEALEQQRQQELAAAEKARLLIEAGEKERFAGLIKQRIESRWHRPPGARKGLSAQLSLRLLPTGELEDVAIISKSGSPVFDQSALQAARSVKVYPVPKDNRVFEKYFRSFGLEFNPER